MPEMDLALVEGFCLYQDEHSLNSRNSGRRLNLSVPSGHVQLQAVSQGTQGVDSRHSHPHESFVPIADLLDVDLCTARLPAIT